MRSDILDKFHNMNIRHSQKTDEYCPSAYDDFSQMWAEIYRLGLEIISANSRADRFGREINRLQNEKNIEAVEAITKERNWLASTEIIGDSIDDSRNTPIRDMIGRLNQVLVDLKKEKGLE